MKEENIFIGYNTYPWYKRIYFKIENFLFPNKNIFYTRGCNNIILGNGADVDNANDSYMLVIGNWKQKMNHKQYEEAHKTMLQVINTCRTTKDSLNYDHFSTDCNCPWHR